MSRFQPAATATIFGASKWFYWQRKLASEVVVVETGPSRSVTVSPDFQRIASVDFDGKMTVRDAVTGREILSLKCRSGGILHFGIGRGIDRATDV